MNKKINLIRDGENVGKCELEIEKDNIAFLEKVIIYKKYRGNGYCYYLIKKAVNLDKKMNMIKIYLHVKHDNESAIKCYKNKELFYFSSFDEAEKVVNECINLIDLMMDNNKDDIIKLKNMYIEEEIGDYNDLKEEIGDYNDLEESVIRKFRYNM
jgi:ribosomal protein S18 acetylase RimI-like enzyme